MTRNKLIITILLSLFFIHFLSAKEIKVDPKLIKGELSNGLTYYIYPNDYPKGEAVYRLFIKSGSLYETEEQRGLAHFLEHMAFNGTKTFPGNSLIKYLESKGAKFGKDLNAHTSYNETVYKLQLPTTSTGLVDTTLLILRDWIDGIVLDSAQIEAERGVILSEWLSRTGPQAEVNDALLNMLLNNSRYSERKVIGDTAVIKNFDHQLLHDYYQTWYRPDIMAVAIVGDVDPVKMEQAIKKTFSKIPNKKRKKLVNYPIPDYEKSDAKTVVHESLSKPQLTSVQFTPKIKNVKKEKDYISYLQKLMLNRLMNARLNAISFDNTSYSNGSIGISDFLNTKGMIISSVELKPDKMDEGINVFNEDVKQIFKYGFLPVEINKVKKSYLSQLKRAAESNNPTISSTIMDEIYADFYKGYTVTTDEEEYRLFKNNIDKIDSLSLVNILHRIIEPNKTHYLLTSFQETQLTDSLELLNTISALQSKEVEPYKLDINVPEELLGRQPIAGKIIKESKINEIDGTEILLSNGVKVIYKPAVSSKDRISFSAFKKGGLYALDSIDYPSGVFSANVISLSGAGDFSRDELSYYLAGNTSNVKLMIEKTRSGVVGSSSVNDIETLFQLLYLRWTQPRLDSSVFDLTKKMSIENYLNQNKTDQTKFYEKLSDLMRVSDYTNRELTDSIIENHVHLDKMIPIFNQSFGNANGFTFVIISDMSLSELEPYILTYIGGLPSNNLDNEDSSYVYNGGTIRTTKAELIEEAGDSERSVVNLIFQQTEIPMNYTEYKLKSEILEAIIKMKLTSILREEMGMVYSTSVSSSSTIHPNELSRSIISFSCLPSNADTLINEIVKILNTLSSDPTNFEKELTDVKMNQVKVMKANIQRDSFWSTHIRNLLFNNEDYWNYVNDFESIVTNISTEEISKLVDFNFDQDNMIKTVLLPKNK